MIKEEENKEEKQARSKEGNCAWQEEERGCRRGRRCTVKKER